MEGAQLLGCKVGQWPMTYLGFSIGISSKRKAYWEPLVKRFHSKLASWKADTLNLAGRSILIKSVLDSLPTYWLGLHMLPSGVYDRIERIRRDFLWGSFAGQEDFKRKMHSVRWSKVCSSKDHGGLGLVPIKVKNLALLGKWSFRWDKERHRSWNIWIRDKYKCPKHSNLQESLVGKRSSNSLQDMGSAACHPLYKRKLDRGKLVWRLGNGIQVLFWEDIWHEDMALMDRYKKLYSISTLQGTSIALFLNQWQLVTSVESLWTRSLRAWEIEELNSLVLIIKGTKLNTRQDSLICQVSRSEFSVR